MGDCDGRNYHEVMSKVETAVEQLASLSGNVADVSDKSSRDREATLRVREERVDHLQTR